MTSFNRCDIVVLTDKRTCGRLWSYQGESNWREDHSVLMSYKTGNLEHVKNGNFRMATKVEQVVGRRNKELGEKI